ncbi:MAG: cation:proton antiporter [Gemmatimonadales bacterium]|nr:cation:proton antiporter [Gemmatimonadales bacterium]
MHDSHDFLRNLALVLSVAAAATIVFQRLRQPVVFGYLVAGMIVGPHLPVPLVADERMVHTLAELGVILLMFALGLEFSLRKLFQVGASAGIIAVLQTSMMVALGYLAGRAFGWTALESVYAGAVIAISSTTIIVKAFAEQGITGRFTQIVFGVLIIEDLIAIFLLAILTAVSEGGGISAGALASTAGRLGAFLLGLLVVGLLVVPRLIRLVVRLDRAETIVVTAVGLSFAASYLALSFGYSVALGAFLAGSLVAESGEEKIVEHLVQPVRDIFAAIFFVAVGMLIDPRLVAEHWLAVVVFTLLVIVGKVLAVTAGAFLAGSGTRTAIQSGMSLAQIGEFSFIIAGVGLTTRATRDFLYPVAVAVSAITTLTTPWLIRSAGPVASYVDRKLPRPIQTVVGLYGSWMERLRRSSSDRTTRSRERRLIGLLLLDAALLAALVAGVYLGFDGGAASLARTTGFDIRLAAGIILLIAALCAAPLLIGFLRVYGGLGQALAIRALPATARSKVDLAAAPRRAFLVTWQLVMVILVSIPLLVVSAPLLPAPIRIALVVVALAIFGVRFWRGATNLQGHTRAGAEIIVAALARQMAGSATVGSEMATVHGAVGRPGGVAAVADGDGEPRTLTEIYDFIPGLGEPVSVRISKGEYAVGRSLSELDLRDQTEASVLVIVRDGESVVLPVGREILRAGDVLALAGTHEAVERAREVLAAGPPSTQRTVAGHGTPA